MKKLATARTIERIERYINEFWCSTSYRVDPETLALYRLTDNGPAPAPTGFSVVRYRGGFMFQCDR